MSAIVFGSDEAKVVIQANRTLESRVKKFDCLCEELRAEMEDGAKKGKKDSWLDFDNEDLTLKFKIK